MDEAYNWLEVYTDRFAGFLGAPDFGAHPISAANLSRILKSQPQIRTVLLLLTFSHVFQTCTIVRHALLV